MLLVSMVLMNMLIAIVMDAYGEVKDGAKDSKTMGEEVMILIRRTIGERPSLHGTVGVILRKTGICDISPTVPLMEIAIVIKGKVNGLKRKQKFDQNKYLEWVEQQYHHKGATKETPPVDPAKCPEKYEVPNLKIDSLCRMVHHLSRDQARELLLDMVQRYHQAHQRSASYEDCRLHLSGLLHDLKALKHVTRDNLMSPNTMVPDKSFLVRCAVEEQWVKLRPKEPDQEFQAHEGEAPQNFEHTTARLERELVGVRAHVDEELAKVSAKHWKLSQVREERVALENACQLLQDKATDLAIQNGVLHSKVPDTGQAIAASENSKEALNLMQHLANEQRKLHTQLTARGLDIHALHQKK